MIHIKRLAPYAESVRAKRKAEKVQDLKPSTELMLLPDINKPTIMMYSLCVLCGSSINLVGCNITSLDTEELGTLTCEDCFISVIGINVEDDNTVVLDD